MVSKTLILVPNLNKLAGISLHYKGLIKYWQGNIQYFEVTKSKTAVWKLSLIYITNYFKYLYKLLTYRPNLIVINISLKKGFYSKIIYQMLGKAFGIKIVTFIHGWDMNCEPMLKSCRGKIILNLSNGFIVLSKYIKVKLNGIGILNNILLSTTKVDEVLLKDFDIKKRTGEIKSFLFLSRVEKSKGIFLALDIFEKLQNEYPYLNFNIAGEGNAIEEVKQYISKKNLHNINILGRLSGKSLIKAFSENDSFFLLSETEGMPAALLEAMSFGMFIITRPVGGIPDFFVDKKMGIMSKKTNKTYYYNRIKKMINNPSYVKDIGLYNYAYAKEHFYASIVANKLEEFFNNLSK